MTSQHQQRLQRSFLIKGLAVLFIWTLLIGLADRIAPIDLPVSEKGASRTSIGSPPNL